MKTQIINAFFLDIIDTILIFLVGLSILKIAKKSSGHPKQPHIHAIRLKFNGREDQTNRPIIKLNNKELYNFGFLPTFEEYGTPIYCMKKDDKSLDRYKLVAFLDKTELRTVYFLFVTSSTIFNTR